MEQGYTPAVDIWAVGCIMYHLICGKPPFEAESQAATYELIRTHRYSAIPASQVIISHLDKIITQIQTEKRKFLRRIRFIHQVKILLYLQ